MVSLADFQNVTNHAKLVCVKISGAYLVILTDHTVFRNLVCVKQKWHFQV